MDMIHHRKHDLYFIVHISLIQQKNTYGSKESYLSYVFDLNFDLHLLTNFCIVSAVNVLSDPSTSTDFIKNNRKRPEDDIFVNGQQGNIATNGMLEVQPTERYKAISLQAVDKVAER